MTIFKSSWEDIYLRRASDTVVRETTKMTSSNNTSLSRDRLRPRGSITLVSY